MVFSHKKGSLSLFQFFDEFFIHSSIYAKLLIFGNPFFSLGIIIYEKLLIMFDLICSRNNYYESRSPWIAVLTVSNLSTYMQVCFNPTEITARTI